MFTFVAHALDTSHSCFFGTEAASIRCLEPIFEQVVGVLASLAGIVFFIMLLVGGFRYLFSGGNAKATEAAKGTLTAAFLGLALIVASYIFIRLLAVFTGIEELGNFVIPNIN